MTEKTARDREHARKLEDWLATRAGKSFLQAEEELVLGRLAHWARSGRTLLEVNCGLGHLQQPLRGMGLDVTGLEPSPALRERFVQTLGPRYLMAPGHADLLPHADGSFDWVLLHLERGLESDFLETALAEARRVAQMGVAVLVWNRLSLAGLLPAKERPPFTPLNVLRLHHLLRQPGEGRVRLHGRLFGPPRFWKADGREEDRQEAPGQNRDRSRAQSSPQGRLHAMGTFCRRLCPRGAAGIFSRLASRIAAPFAAVCLLVLEFPPSRPMTATPIKFRGFKFANQGLVEGCGERFYRDGRDGRGGQDARVFRENTPANGNSGKNGACPGLREEKA